MVELVNTAPLRFATFDQFIEHCSDRFRQIKHVDPTVRYGQIVFNELERCRPDVSEQIRGTVNDPFHKDFLHATSEEFIRSRW